MTVLNDEDIKKAIISGEIVIEGLDPDTIELASVDLTLAKEFMIFKNAHITHIDPRNTNEDLMEKIEIGKDKPFIIHPGEFVLGCVSEKVKIPSHLVARLDGRSSLGRLGLIVHSTAGSIDPGFEGKITLEIANIAKIPISLWPGMKICRLTFDKLSNPCAIDYSKKKDAKYNNPIGPEGSKIFNEMKRQKEEIN